VLDRREAGRLFNTWCERFMQPVKLRTGKWRYRGLHWHAFSSHLCPAESGRCAFEHYSAANSGPLIVIPEFWREYPAVECLGNDENPDLTPTGLDLYVFPRSLAWTMVFTHEQPGHGPYFSRAE
jgi:hypothetical protein